MNKIESVMELYKSVFPHVLLEKRGTWIRVNQGNGDPPVNLYSNHLLEEIFDKTGNMYEWDSELKSLHMVAAHTDALWDTNDINDSWNTNDGWNTEEQPEEENIFEDIGEV